MVSALMLQHDSRIPSSNSARDTQHDCMAGSHPRTRHPRSSFRSFLLMARVLNTTDSLLNDVNSTSKFVHWVKIVEVH